MSSYDSEVKQRFGDSAAYEEYKEKTSDYSKDKWQKVNSGLNAIFSKFGKCMMSGNSVDSNEVQTLVEELQDYISENYYTCGYGILAGLGQMYVADQRFKENIDKYALGTSNFISKAIQIYCHKQRTR